MSSHNNRFSFESGALTGRFLTSFQKKLLLKNLQADLRPEYHQRIEIMLLADLGESQAQICAKLGCSQETARYWIAMAQTGQAHNWDTPSIGRPKTINDNYLKRLQELASHSPRDYGYPFRNWTARWLSSHLAQELGIEISDRHVNRLLKKMGLSSRNKSPQQENQAAKTSHIVIRNLPSSSLPQSHLSLS